MRYTCTVVEKITKGQFCVHKHIELSLYFLGYHPNRENRFTCVSENIELSEG